MCRRGLQSGVLTLVGSADILGNPAGIFAAFSAAPLPALFLHLTAVCNSTPFHSVAAHIPLPSFPSLSGLQAPNARPPFPCSVPVFFVLPPPLSSLLFALPPAAGLFKNIGTGATDFFYQPMQALVEQPDQFFSAVGAGTSSLVKNSVYGIFNTGSLIAGNVSRGMVWCSSVLCDARLRPTYSPFVPASCPLSRCVPPHAGRGVP